MNIFTQNEGKMAELVVDALVENLNQVLAFTEEQLDLFGSSMKFAMKIQIAVEEIYVNIAHYAYGNETGKASVLMEHLPDISSVRITFKDSGTPYNPLAHEDPDITLEAEKRSIGGLGILMVKKTMDKVEYEFKDGQNCLTITTTI